MLVFDEPVLIFGGPYGNLEATQAVLEQAACRAIASRNIICTGDLVAYCASPVETIETVRAAKIHVVMGNCDEQLAAGADDCGCGYPVGSACERLSAQWFAFADQRVGPDLRRYLASLPKQLDLSIGGRKLAVVHGTPSAINQFVFAATPWPVKAAEIARTGLDGIVAGHCGLPFSHVTANTLWHNPGVIGLPGNDGTPRVWYSIIQPHSDGLMITHHALDYDYETAALRMERNGISLEYAMALRTGLWPSCEVLTPDDIALRGRPLDPRTVVWPAGPL